MQILKTLSLTLLLASPALSIDATGQVNGKINAIAGDYKEMPIKTIVIKHPAANDPATFFSTNTLFSFEVYKPGDMSKIIAAIKQDPDVLECGKGNVTGDYHQVNLSLKTTKDKAWFAALFKKAGLASIKINNNPIVEVAKM